MDEENSYESGGFDWGNLLNKAVDTTAKVVASKVDKPNTATQSGNVLTPTASAGASSATTQTAASSMPGVKPWMLYAGVGAVGLVVVLVLVMGKRR